MNSFKDNFSKQSDIYVQFRPLYPDELYAYLSSLTNQHDLAWDCGTGNGQAAIGLAKFYKTIVATDPSEQQISNCFQNEKVKYFVESAENCSLESKSADLITLANVLHWLDFEVFYEVVKRVLKPGGIIAAWCYALPTISPDIDKIIDYFHFQTLNDYWLPENRLVEKGYETIPFPFDQIESPVFFSQKSMNLKDFIGYLNTWSGTQRFINQNGFNPTNELFETLKSVWKDTDSQKLVTWKLALKTGRQAY